MWHAWHSVTSAFTLWGRCGTGGTGLALLARLVPVVAAAVWQAWHLATLTFTLCGRRGTYGMHWLWWHAWLLLSPRLFVWQTWHLEASTSILCGRCGTSRGKRCTYRIGLAPRLFAPQTWHLKAHLATSQFTLSGRRGTCGTGLALVARFVPLVAAAVCVAHVACRRIHFVWHAWHSVTSAFTLCGRCPTYGTGLALVARFVPIVAAPVFVAGVAFGSIHLHSVWHTWHSVTSAFTLWGRCGTYGTGLPLVARLVPVVAAAVCVAVEKHTPPFCVASVALGDIDLHFVWQVSRLWHWAGSCGALCSHCRRVCFCGGRGVWKHPPPFCVAHVAFGDIDLHFVWQAWHLATLTFTLCGMQVSRLWHWAGSCGALCSHCRRACFCGGRGVWKHPPPFCVAHVAFGDIDLHFVWQGSFPSSSCTCSRHYVASGCFDARAEKQPFACRRHLRWTVSFHYSPGSSLSAIINCFAAKTRSCREDRPLWSWRNCLWPHMPHSHFTHNSFTHNALTHN